MPPTAPNQDIALETLPHASHHPDRALSPDVAAKSSTKSNPAAAPPSPLSRIRAAFLKTWAALCWISRLEAALWRRFSAGLLAKAARRVRKAWICTSWTGRALVMLAVFCGITVSCYRLRIEVHQPFTGIRSVNGQPARVGGVYFYGGLQKWDVDAKTLQLQWVPQWCTGTTDCLSYLLNHTLLFTDIDALGIGGFNASAAALDIQADASNDQQHWQQTFDLVIKEWPRRFEASNVNGLDTDALYPFESYTLRTLIAAADADDLTRTYDVLGGDIVNWVQSDWVALYDYDYIDDLPGRGVILNFLVTMRRHPIVKVFAIIIAAINWALTIALAYMTLAYTMGGRELPPGSDSVTLMFTALFALPTVRSTMPGNPPFGCLLDAVGIIPNLLIVAVCATWLLLHKSCTYVSWSRRPLLRARRAASGYTGPIRLESHLISSHQVALTETGSQSAIASVRVQQHRTSRRCTSLAARLLALFDLGCCAHMCQTDGANWDRRCKDVHVRQDGESESDEDGSVHGWLPVGILSRGRARICTTFHRGYIGLRLRSEEP